MRLTSDLLAVKPVKQAERVFGGNIYLPATAQAPFMQWAEVLATGAGHRGERSKTLWPMFAQPGDIVLYPNGAARLQYENVQIDGEMYDKVAFVHERDAGLIIRNGEYYPLYRRLVGHIITDRTHQVRPSGLIIPVEQPKKVNDASTSFVRVMIDHVGFGQRNDLGEVIPNTCKVGDVILVDKFDAWEYEIGGAAVTGHVIIDEDQILAIDEDFTPPSDEDKAIEDAYNKALRKVWVKGKGWVDRG